MYKLPGSKASSDLNLNHSKSVPKFQNRCISKLPSIKQIRRKLKRIQSNFSPNDISKLNSSKINIDKTSKPSFGRNSSNKMTSNVTPISKQELVTILTKYKNKIDQEKGKEIQFDVPENN